MKIQRYLVAAILVLPAACSGASSQALGPNWGPTTNSNVGQERPAVSGNVSRKARVNPNACTDPTVFVSSDSSSISPTVNGYSCTTEVSSLGGSATGIHNSAPIAVDELTQKLYVVAGLYEQKINIFAASATGNVSPGSTLTSATAGLNVRAITIDQDGYIWVDNDVSTFMGNLMRFAPNAHGSSTPLQTIIPGPNNSLFTGAFIGGLATDSSGNIYTANTTESEKPQIIEFAATASGDATPIRTIAGSNTGIGAYDGIAVDSNGRILDADESTNTVRVFAANASGNATPIQILHGSATNLNDPTSIQAGPIDNFYVANVTTVTKYLASATGNSGPVETINNGSGTYGLALCSCSETGPKRR